MRRAPAAGAQMECGRGIALGANASANDRMRSPLPDTQAIRMNAVEMRAILPL